MPPTARTLKKGLIIHYIHIIIAMQMILCKIFKIIIHNYDCHFNRELPLYQSYASDKMIPYRSLPIQCEPLSMTKCDVDLASPSMGASLAHNPKIDEPQPTPLATLSLINCTFFSALTALQRRYSAYLAAAICAEISDHDDMFADPYIPPGSRSRPLSKMEHYMFVGRSAIDLIARAMVCTHKDQLSSILDLPCGGGRVTRHLKAFLPDARLFVCDLDKQKEAFTIRNFGASAIDPGADFSIPPTSSFDLVFVGSLFTHFGPDQYKRAIRWFIDAMAPDGLLVFTTHGRRTFHRFSVDFQSEEWRDGVRNYLQTGFGYRPYRPAMPSDGPSSYGTSLSAPHWVARLVESDPGVRIVHLAEAAWANNQDVVVLQKKPLTVE